MCKITPAQHFRQQHFNVLVFITSSLRSKEASSVKIRGRKLKHQVRRDADKSCFTVFVFYLLKQEGTRTILNVFVARWLDEVTKTRVLKQHDLYLNLTDPKHDGCFHKNLYIFTKKPFSTSEWIFSHIINVHLHIWIKYVHTCGSEFLHMETYFQAQAQSLRPRRINPALDSSWTPSWLFPQTHESETSIRTCTHGGDSRGFYLQSLSNHSFTLLWNLSSSSPSLPPGATVSHYHFIASPHWS